MFFLKLHPLIVHFPVGLLVSGAVLLAYGKLQNEEAALTAGEFNVRLGFFCALAVIAVGLAGAVSLDVRPNFKPFLSSHIRFALLTALVFAAALLTKRFLKNRWGKLLYGLLVAIGLCSVVATGFYGGELVHRFGVSTPHLTE